MIFPSQLSAMLTGMQSQQTPAATTAAPAVAPAATTAAPANAGLLSSLLGPQTSNVLRAMALGAGNIQQGADPYIAFGQGLGGTQAAFQAQTDKARQEQLEREKLQYQQAQDLLNNTRADKSLSLQEQNYNADNQRSAAAEQRQALNDELYRKKVEAELERMGQQAGLTPSQMLDLDKRAGDEAARLVGVDMDGKPLDQAKYEQVKAEKKQAILSDITGAKSPSVGPGVSGDPAAIPTATGPNGQKVKLVNGAWVPVE